MASSYNLDQILVQMKQFKGDKKKLLLDFQKTLQVDEKAVREWKYKAGIMCPNPDCNQELPRNIVCNGKMPGSDRQRYVCRNCGKSFNDHTDTPLHYTKMLLHWPAFLKTMLDGETIRESAKTIGISPATAHAWKKKILKYMAAHMPDVLSGMVVEMADRTVKTSHKGQKADMVCGLPPQQQLLFMADRAQGVLAAHIKENDQMRKVVLSSAAVSIADHSSSLLQQAAAERPKNSSPADRLLLHSENAGQFMRNFSEEYARMRGVATTYLHQYAVWYGLLRQLEGKEPKAKVLSLLQHCL